MKDDRIPDEEVTKLSHIFASTSQDAVWLGQLAREVKAFREGPSLEKLLQTMADHAAEYPTHGYNCSCKDRYLGQARVLIDNRGALFKSQFMYLAAVMLRNG